MAMNQSSFDDKLDELNARMLEALAAWQAQCKESDVSDGLDNYYRKRLENGDILNAVERWLAAYLALNYPKRSYATVVEIAAGAGQLALAARRLGAAAVAVEHRRERGLLALYLAGDEASYVVFTGPWKNHVTDVSYGDGDVLVSINAVSSGCCAKTDASAFNEHLRQGGHLILNPQLYGDRSVDLRDLIDAPWVQLPHNLVLWRQNR